MKRLSQHMIANREKALGDDSQWRQKIQYIWVQSRMSSSNMSSRETRGEDVAWSIVRRLAGTNALAAFEAREGDVKAAKEVAGTYLTNRRTFFGAVALFFIGTETTVTADKGFIVVDGDTRYAPLGNDVWVALNGFRLRAARGEDGSIVRLHTSLGSATLERVSFWGSTRPIVFAIGLSAFLAVTTLLGMWYRTGRKTQTTLRGRRAMWIACVSAVLWVAFTALLIPTLSTFSNIDLGTLDKTGFPITLTLTLATLAALALQAIIHVLGLYWVWVGSGWGLWRRVHYTLFGLVFAYAMIRIAQFGAIGVPLYG